MRASCLSVLVETNIIGLLSETLTADHQAVLSDQTAVGGADTALTAALTESSWVGVPDVLVSHFDL